MQTKSESIKHICDFITLVSMQHNSKVVNWMSDAGGEYKSNTFDVLLKQHGINILQSTPYILQQNGHMERFMHTMMDKAEAMCHEVCILPSYWEFATQHAIHIYNQTLMKRLNWHTPYELLLSEISDISHLQVFGCGAYVHISLDVWTNKLALKSKLMTYLGVAIGNQCNHIFMQSPNNVVFTSTYALFNEAMFPYCKTQPKKHNIQIQQDTAPNDPTRLLLDMSNDDDPLLEWPSKAPAPAVECPETPEQPDAPPPALQTPQHAPRQPPQAPPAAPHHSEHEKKVPFKLDNIYNERRYPVQQYKNAEKFFCWKETVNEQPSVLVIPRPSSLEPPDEIPDIAKLCWKEGENLAHYLLAKAIRSNNNLTKPPCEWLYHNISKLLPDEHKQWENACYEELDMLWKCKVYKIIDCLKDWKVIQNWWVFDAKLDGQKNACLVVKGFS